MPQKQVLISRSADKLKEGDQFVDAFIRVDHNYPDPRTVLKVEADERYISIHLANEIVNVFQGMKVIVAERA